MLDKLKKLTRTNTALFPYIYFAALVTAISTAIFGNFAWYWWVLSIGVYFLTGCLGITVTFHRYLTHRTFKMPKFLEYLFSWFGAIGGTGSAIGWVAVHQVHHHNSDLEKDPHSPHIYGWKLFVANYPFDMNTWSVRKLIVDPFHRFVHEYYNLLLVLWGLLLMAIDIKFLLFGFIVPIVLQITISNLSNYWNHYPHATGYQNFDTGDYSTNSWWLALLAWGEGWHNNHHAKPWSYTFKEKWWEFDPSAWVINLIRTDKSPNSVR